ncbi:MAG TPA: HNH endonuclease family protein [Thermoanaerobaculia bacterium]|nr:HNH endonuclease family protein [Thermoanaerobaculia bacterium]
MEGDFGHPRMLRRAFCGLTTKNYNRVFLNLTRTLQTDKPSPEQIARHLSSLKGESTEWPGDLALHNAWQRRHVYQMLQNPKVVHILWRLNEAYMTSRNEPISIDGQLTVEHILPQSWIANWLLSDGSRGLSWQEIQAAPEDDPIAAASRRRNEMLQTVGNLTIVASPPNSAISHSAWQVKKPAIQAASLLPINQQFLSVDQWDEAAILSRSQELFRHAVRIWPAPSQE